MAGPDPGNAPETNEGPEAYSALAALTRRLLDVPEAEVQMADARDQARTG